MASFGRRPAKGGLGASSRPAAGASDAFRRMKEEEAERERFEKEHAEREVRQEDEAARPPPARPPEAETTPSRPNPRVFLEIEVRAPELLGRSGRVEASGRVEFELFADVAPKTAENFRCLCTGGRGRDLHFEGCAFHRVIPGFMAQGGDITDGDGTGGRSIYGKIFADEAFVRRHDERGMLSMANSGPGTNNSQFFILFKPTPHLDRKHVVFGRLLRDPADVLRKVEARGSKTGDVKGQVVIAACGELDVQGSEGRRARSRSRSRSRRRARRRSASSDSASRSN